MHQRCVVQFGTKQDPSHEPWFLPPLQWKCLFHLDYILPPKVCQVICGQMPFFCLGLRVPPPPCNFSGCTVVVNSARRSTAKPTCAIGCSYGVPQGHVSASTRRDGAGGSPLTRLQTRSHHPCPYAAASPRYCRSSGHEGTSSSRGWLRQIVDHLAFIVLVLLYKQVVFTRRKVCASVRA